MTERICKPVIGVSPEIGEAQDTDSRICMAKIGVGPTIGESGVIILYGSSGAIDYGTSDEIIY